MSSGIPVILALLICLGLGPSVMPLARGAAADSKSAPSKPVPSQGTTAQQDKAIEAAIREKLAKSKIGKDGFTVRVQGGVAYWEGTTSVVQHKGSATRMAKSAGALRVVNNIKLSEAAKAKAAENLEEGRRRAQVKRGDPRDAGRPASPSGKQTSASPPQTGTKPANPPGSKPNPAQTTPAGPPQVASQ